MKLAYELGRCDFRSDKPNEPYESITPTKTRLFLLFAVNLKPGTNQQACRFPVYSFCLLPSTRNTKLTNSELVKKSPRTWLSYCLKRNPHRCFNLVPSTQYLIPRTTRNSEPGTNKLANWTSHRRTL